MMFPVLRHRIGRGAQTRVSIKSRLLKGIWERWCEECFQTARENLTGLHFFFFFFLGEMKFGKKSEPRCKTGQTDSLAVGVMTE